MLTSSFSFLKNSPRSSRERAAQEHHGLFSEFKQRLRRGRGPHRRQDAWQRSPQVCNVTAGPVFLTRARMADRITRFCNQNLMTMSLSLELCAGGRPQTESDWHRLITCPCWQAFAGPGLRSPQQAAARYATDSTACCQRRICARQCAAVQLRNRCDRRIQGACFCCIPAED